MHKFIYIFICLFFCFVVFFTFQQNVEADEFVPVEVEVIYSCGDGFVQLTETCDKGFPPIIPENVGTSTCQNFNDIFGNFFVSGVLHCSNDCSSFATSSCYTCGNGYKEEVEECDGGSLGGLSCTSMGDIGGGGSKGGSSGIAAGYNPGSVDELKTQVIVNGKSYPHADVHILVDGVVVGIVSADAKANFYFETNEISPGVASFGFWSEDADGLKSTLLTLTFRVISGAVTNISGVYISPTIDIVNKSVKQGENVVIYGQTVPQTEVQVHIHSDEQFVEEIKSNEESGKWELVFNTEPLEEDFHTAKALFQVEINGNIIKSGFSKAISFYVGKIGGEAPCPEADLNHDGRVNLTDFSILLYYWGTDNTCADQNQNGVVDLVDFSIMMYYWTG